MLGGLAGSYDVHLLGIGYRGPVRDVRGVTLHPTNLEGGDVFGAFAAADLVEEVDARGIFLLNDLWMLHTYMHTLPRVRDRAAILAYVPVDGEIVDDALLAPLTAIDRFVTYTEFGRREIAASLERLGRDPQVAVVPHGVDTGTFRPLPAGRIDAKQRLFPDAPEWQESFVVLNANRPLERKRIDLTLEGFALFARGKPPGVKLWLHHAVMDADERVRIVSKAERFGVTPRLRMAALGAPPLPDRELNVVYNACEVGLNTAMGEGWGLVSLEHAATGAAQVVPGSSACAELWAGAAEVVEAEETGVPPFSPLAMRTVSPAGVAAALERLYADRDHLDAMSSSAYRMATRPEFRWEAIAEQWRSVVAETVASHAAQP